MHAKKAMCRRLQQKSPSAAAASRASSVLSALVWAPAACCRACLHRLQSAEPPEGHSLHMMSTERMPLLCR